MPVHDWTRVEAGVFHDFHNAWISELRGALNEGLLPTGYYAMSEQPGRRFPTCRCFSIPTITSTFRSRRPIRRPGAEQPSLGGACWSRAAMPILIEMTCG